MKKVVRINRRTLTLELPLVFFESFHFHRVVLVLFSIPETVTGSVYLTLPQFQNSHKTNGPFSPNGAIAPLLHFWSKSIICANTLSLSRSVFSNTETIIIETKRGKVPPPSKNLLLFVTVKSLHVGHGGPVDFWLKIVSVVLFQLQGVGLVTGIRSEPERNWSKLTRIRHRGKSRR